MSPLSARGVALVEQVIAAASSKKPSTRKPAPRQRVPEEPLAALRFPGGEPLPPSLRCWLAFDADEPHLVGDPAAPAFTPLTLAELLDQEFGAGTARYGWEEICAALPGDCYLLPGGSDSRRFLYVGRADALGEYPVLAVDTDEMPFACVSHPGFDVWLAEDAEILGVKRTSYTSLFDDPTLGAAMAEQARQNLGGRRWLGGEEPGFLPDLPLVTARVQRGVNPFTKEQVAIEVKEPAPGAVPAVQAPGFAARRR
jgi:hypothetical protein